MAEKLSKGSAISLVDQVRGLLDSLELSMHACDEQIKSFPKFIEEIRLRKGREFVSNIYVHADSNDNRQPIALDKLIFDKRYEAESLTDENGVAHTVGAYAARLHEGMRIDISSSRRTTDSTAAVKAAFAADMAIQIKDGISNLIEDAHEEVDPLIEDLAVATSSL